jgi:flagellum-specific ATP synthase
MQTRRFYLATKYLPNAFIDVFKDPPDPLRRRKISEIFETGIRTIDGLLTLGKGQRVGLFAGSGVGKSKLLGNITRFAKADIVVVNLIGERGRWELNL